jgi:hypothetical protein
VDLVIRKRQPAQIILSSRKYSFLASASCYSLVRLALSVSTSATRELLAFEELVGGFVRRSAGTGDMGAIGVLVVTASELVAVIEGTGKVRPRGSRGVRRGAVASWAKARRGMGSQVSLGRKS